MSASNQIVRTNKNFVITPTNITEAMNYAKLIADSAFCPRDFKGKQGDVLVAMQMGAEIGLSPIQALQNIAVINGRPCVWGDAALAVVISHRAYISHREWFEGSIQEGNLTAYCGITRKNSDEYIKSFSMEDAKKANLWSKAGVWQQYPNRMLQMRARAFCIRDKFADALRGISIREEVEDYEIKEIKSRVVPYRKQVDKIEKNENLKLENIIDVKAVENEEFDIIECELLISQCASLEELQDVFAKFYKHYVSQRDNESLTKLVEMKDKKKFSLGIDIQEDSTNSSNQKEVQ